MNEKNNILLTIVTENKTQKINAEKLSITSVWNYGS